MYLTEQLRKTTDFRCDPHDPNTLYRELRRDAPIIEGDILRCFEAPSQAGYKPDRPIYSLFRHDDCMRVLRDPETFQSGLIMEGLGTLVGKFLLTGMDGKSHRFHRGLVQPAFTPAVADGWRRRFIDPVIRRDFVEPAVADGRANLMGMAQGFPISIIYSILGFPDNRAASEQFAAWALQIVSGALVDPAKAAEARASGALAAQHIYDHVFEIVARRRAEDATGDDLMARLIRAEFEGRSMDDDEVTNFIRMLLPAAAETTTSTFAILMQLLLERPELLARVRADRSLLPKALDEAVRLDPTSCYKARLAATDVEIRGVLIPKGAALSLCVASANRDEAIFEHSETYDIDRAGKPSFGFGFGAHMCLGMFVAKAEILSAVNGILDLMPNIRLDPDYPPPRIVGVQQRGPDAVHVIWG